MKLSHFFPSSFLSGLSSQTDYALFEEGFRITFEAGQFAQRLHKKDITIRSKGVIDVVTNVDIATENLILSFLQDKYPEHGFISEETSPFVTTQTEYSWIIDPIDGTTNFAHGLPFWAVSVALYKNSLPFAGWVYAPELDTFFFGLKNVGSWVNSRRIFVSTKNNLSSSLLSTGFPYDIRTTDYTNLDLFSHFSKKTMAVRRFGSAAIDICYVAAGVLDGHWEQILKLWDFAAASLILTEAGGIITTMKQTPLPLKDSSVLCANSVLHAILVKEISSFSQQIRPE